MSNLYDKDVLLRSQRQTRLLRESVGTAGRGALASTIPGRRAPVHARLFETIS
jgi:hypothetical protein